MTSTIFFFAFIPLLALILLAVNLIFAPHSPYMEKEAVFECGFSSFLGQNRTQFSISFFIFALLFLLFDLEILLVYPYLVSAYTNDVYGLAIMLMFLLALTLGFAFELGKKALSIDSRQSSSEVPEQNQTTSLSCFGYLSLVNKMKATTSLPPSPNSSVILQSRLLGSLPRSKLLDILPRNSTLSVAKRPQGLSPSITPQELLNDDRKDRVKEKEKEEKKGKKEKRYLVRSIYLEDHVIFNLENFIAEFSRLKYKTRYFIVLRVGYNNTLTPDDTILREVPFYILNNPVFMEKKYAALLDLITSRIKASMKSYVQNGENRKGEDTITIRLMVYKICFTYGTSTVARKRYQHQYRTRTRTYKRRLKGRRMVFSMKRLEHQRKLEHQLQAKHQRKLEHQRKVYAYISATTPPRGR